MTTCSATTAAGTPCKNHAVKGSQLCKAHGGSTLDIANGAPPGNTNALKHGFYRPTIREDEYADLLTYAEQFDLADELAITRVRLRRLMTYIDAHEDKLDPDQYGRLTALIYTAVRTIADITLKLDGHQPDHWDIVLNQLSIDLGMDL
jgi:hypothetical protein